MGSRLPAWFRQEIPDASLRKTMQRLSAYKLHTVCKEARCPNVTACFKQSQLTFMILGDVCTRDCRFCAVRKSTGEQLSVDANEPFSIARVVRELGLRYAVITSVTRDDLEDGGASQFVRTIEAVRSVNNNPKIEALIPDFKGNHESMKAVALASPDVLGHNIETVRRLYPLVRPGACYAVSLDLLRCMKEYNPGLVTKSSLMLGMGETEEEITRALTDLRNGGCDIVTLGQYLAPSNNHFQVREFIGRERFNRYQDIARRLGFKSVLSGPSVRSSYRAQELYTELRYA